MADRSKDRQKPGKDSNSREDRLRSALRANLARRKAQGRARAAQDAGSNEQDDQPAGSTDTGGDDS